MIECKYSRLNTTNKKNATKLLQRSFKAKAPCFTKPSLTVFCKTQVKIHKFENGFDIYTVVVNVCSFDWRLKRTPIYSVFAVALFLLQFWIQMVYKTKSLAWCLNIFKKLYIESWLSIGASMLFYKNAHGNFIFDLQICSPSAWFWCLQILRRCLSCYKCIYNIKMLIRLDEVS